LNPQIASLTRPQHERIWGIVAMIREGEYPNCSTFMRRFEVSRRTILRDLDYLRDRMMAPIRFEPRRNGFYFDKAFDSLPVLEMQESDLVMLFLSRQVLGAMSERPLAAELNAAFDRISSILGNRVAATWNEIGGLISYRSAGVTQAKLQHFKKISAALARRLEIEFDYLKPESKVAERRVVRPYRAAMINGQWYLFGEDAKRQAIRTFVLSRMRNLRVTSQKFETTNEMPLDELLNETFGVVYTPGGTREVCVAFSARVKHVISERKWHQSQRLEQRPDGTLIVRFKVNNTRELSNWVMSWGPDAEVLSPAKLRAEIAEKLRAAAALY